MEVYTFSNINLFINMFLSKNLPLYYSGKLTSITFCLLGLTTKFASFTFKLLLNSLHLPDDREQNPERQQPAYDVILVVVPAAARHSGHDLDVADVRNPLADVIMLLRDEKRGEVELLHRFGDESEVLDDLRLRILILLIRLRREVPLQLVLLAVLLDDGQERGSQQD